MSENTNTPVTFDANSAMQAIKDKIKSAFVELIPDEQWNAMVKKEVDDFFTVKETRFRDEGNLYLNISQFQELVISELQSSTKEKVQEYIKENYLGEWNGRNAGYIVDEKIKGAISENVSSIFENIIGREIDNRLRYNNNNNGFHR